MARILLLAAMAATPARAATLDFEARVEAHRAVERVLWERRIWPESNPGKKPALEEVLPESVLRARVEEVLRESRALEQLWKRPIGSVELQAELDRMVAGSRDPATLEAMFDALGHDPLLIAEAIARPALADRLLRGWYAGDPRFHEAARREAELGYAGVQTSKDLEHAAPGYTVRAQPLDASEARLQDREVGRLGPLEETDEAFTAEVVLSRSDEELRIAVASWPKVTFEAWWSAERERHAPILPEATNAPGAIVIPDLSAALLVPTCADNTWTRTGTGAPSGRDGHGAVWTGTEMIVWGGAEGGGRYNPATDTWTAVSTFGAPVDTFFGALVWTGSAMLAWGGEGRQGGRYDPVTDSWTLMTTAGAPTFVSRPDAAWTGTRLLVWQGTGGYGYPVEGAMYDPAADAWTPMNPNGAPTQTTINHGAWTGSVLVIWPGKRFDPATNTWSPIASTGQPSPRGGHTMVWTGSRVIVWGGSSDLNSDLLNDGALYDPVSDTWTPMTTAGAPVPRDRHSATWVGNRMVVWGGNDRVTSPYTNTGGRYDPVTNTWAPTSLTGAPSGRAYHSVAVAGSRMIVWGGAGAYPINLNTGAVYDPAADTWVPTRAGEPSPPGRSQHIAVWTGAELVLWGGTSDRGLRGDGATYNPATDTWLPTSATSAPTARSGHTAVWSGTSVLVWGGMDANGYPIRGGRYNPAGDAWSEITYWQAPYRTDHTAVWTGSRMIVWGGSDGSGTLGTGALYDPATDVWTPVSNLSAPSPRIGHSAVWTGSTMVVWGGLSHLGHLGTGGRYDPAADAWTPTSTGNAPAGRRSHAAVWTGSRMLVWGGDNGSPLGTGGSYDPAGDAWWALSAAGAPAPRFVTSAVWTGTEMIVWGGSSAAYLDTGGRYRPDLDSWRATTLAAAPRPRAFHSGTWTGSSMLVWGGVANGGTWNDGARYCACLTWYTDGDGDGYGGGPGVSVCDGSHPASTIGTGGDCNDANPAVNPGVLDTTCDVVDDDCDGNYSDDYLPQPTVCGFGVCRAFGSLECAAVYTYNTCVPGTPNSPDDATCNNLDDDCDGAVDDDFPIYYTDHWVPLPNAPSARTNYTAVNSGGEYLVFGGDNGSGTVQTGGIAYSFAGNTWRTLPPGPAKRWHHTAVWADTQMIVWGGDDGATTIYNNGSRYNPSTDSWAATTATGAPLARGGHVAVWTGSRMVIWGGRDVSTYMNTGSRYDPGANSWSATTTTGAPSGRWQATAVWTGTEMIVWGGVAAAGTGLNTGARYNPSTNAWTAVTTTGAPSGRYGHVALWTGTDMLIWGGTSDGSNYLANGARYNPSTDTWTAMATGGPSRRAWASAATFGDEVWIWGGTYRTNEDPNTALGDGMRYLKTNNVWVPMNPYFGPAARARTSAVLTGGDMIVWGGDPNGAAKSDGARYVSVVPCGTGSCQRVGAMVCVNASVSFQCTPGTPQPEVCDGYDNDCNGTSDDNVPAPGGVPTVYGTKLVDNTIVLDWSATPGTSFYDTTRGSLSALRGSGGNFTSATCMQNDNTLTQAWDPAIPAAGEGTWYLVRPANACSGGGSWNEGSAAQQGSRDGELAASALPCP